jgi:hypothetical protein
MEKPAIARPKSETALVVVLVASAGLIFGPFLPWVTAGLLSVSGINKTAGDAGFLMLAGIILAIRMIVAISRKRFVSRAWTICIGVLCLGYSTYLGGLITESFQGAATKAINPTLGLGFFACWISSFVIFVASSKMGRLPEDVQPPKSSDPASA